jgi:hypothetical protein
MTADIIRKIEEKTGIPGIVEMLSEKLSGAELSSLLMEVYAGKAKKITPPLLLRQYRQNRFAHPAGTDMTGLLEKELLLLKHCSAHRFVPIELSPVAQFGACSVVAKADQKKIISAIRHTEVMADATNAIALHIADLRQSGHAGHDLLRFCTVHRHLRTQPLPDPRFSAHFKIGCLVTAGRDSGHFGFELSSLGEHFTLWASVLKEVFHITDVRFRLLARDGYDSTVFLPAAQQYLQDTMGFDVSADQHPSPNQYYKGLQFKVIINIKGQDMEIADGGFNDWTQLLLENKKERLLTSGFGLSFLYQLQQ